MWKAIESLAMRMLVFLAGVITGKNHEKRKAAEHAAEQARIEADAYANQPRTDDALVARLRDAADRARKR